MEDMDAVDILAVAIGQGTATLGDLTHHEGDITNAL